jgi:hypothetical protein
MALVLFSTNLDPQQNIPHTANKLYNIHGCHQNSFQGGQTMQEFFFQAEAIKTFIYQLQFKLFRNICTGNP